MAWLNALQDSSVLHRWSLINIALMFIHCDCSVLEFRRHSNSSLICPLKLPNFTLKYESVYFWFRIVFRASPMG